MCQASSFVLWKRVAPEGTALLDGGWKESLDKYKEPVNKIKSIFIKTKLFLEREHLNI